MRIMKLGYFLSSKEWGPRRSSEFFEVYRDQVLPRVQGIAAAVG
jgi:hypothetical protein